MLRSVIPALLLLPLVVGIGCDGCTDPLSSTDPDSPFNPLDPDLDGAKEPRALSLEGGSPVIAYRGTTVNLAFKVIGESTFEPKSGIPLTITSEGFAATVIGSSFTTGANGIATVPVRADLFDGSLTVTAAMEDVDGTIETAVAVVTIVENPAAVLKVAVSSMTRIPVTTATAHIYVSAGAPTCEVLLAQQAAPPATLTGTFTAIPQTQTYADQPTGRRASVLVFGHGANGATVARGCAATDRLNGGVDNLLTVALTQDDTVITGDYDVLMSAALGQALPEPYDTGVDVISGLLSNPAGYALFFIMQQADILSVGTTLETVAQDGAVGGLWNTLQAALNNQLRTTFGPANCAVSATDDIDCRYDQVRAVGAALRDVVTDFEIGGRFEITEPTPGVYEIQERWLDAVVEWPLPCAPGDEACTRRAISMDTVQAGALAAIYGADIVSAPLGTDTERYTVSTDPHGFDLNYGALILAILNQVVFPALPIQFDPDGPGPQAPRAPRTIREVLGGLVNCNNVATSITGGNSSGFETVIEAACGGGLTLAANFAENQLLDLSVDASNPQLGEEGLQATGTFVLSDSDRNTEVETLKDFNFQLGWYFPANPGQSLDISSPITGAGRRARVTCTDDSVCGGGQVCTPAGSYLKIAAVTFGCSRTIGSLAGGAACTTDAQCGSGMCDPVGLGGALVCFEACDSPADCSMGLTCSEAAGLVDLDTTLNGLGDVLVQGCAAL